MINAQLTLSELRTKTLAILVEKNAFKPRKHPEWDGLKCYYCGIVMNGNLKLGVDARWIPSEEHPQPKSKGGTRIVPACLLCNMFKQMMTEKQFRYLVDLLSFGKGWDIGIANLRITAELAVRQKLSNDFLIELVNFLPKGNGHGFYYLLTTYTFPALQKTFKIDPSGKWGLK